MSKSRKRLTGKTIVAIFLIIIIAILGVILIRRLTVEDNDNNLTQDEQGAEQGSNPISDGNTDNPEKLINDPQGATQEGAPEIGGFITSANISGNYLIIRTQADELLSSGTCELELSKNGIKIEKESDIINSPTNSSCYGFDVPVSELSHGNWQIKITIRSNGRVGIFTSEVAV
ncbi:hypothetical protein LJC07_05015 [Christensenellaceae bacterium OttesenSCG-928-L17]|nr:hypothetical protein [Christensenellaceae bacterium OttesenSCG-928-L17]